MLRPGALPRYQQIAELLMRDIAAGRIADGERLRPEREMADRLGIAVGTLRQALQSLSEKGLLDRRQGSGNYIRAKPDVGSAYAMFRLELLEGGGLPTARVLSVERLAKEPGLPRFGSHAEGYRIRRLRCLSGIPAAVEEIWLDASRAPSLCASELSESLYLFYRDRLHLWIMRAEDRIGQDRLPDWAPSEFPVSPGTVLPRIVRVAEDQQGVTAEASYTWFDPDRVTYVARVS